jgi:Fis family transcriptional regulator
MNSTKKITPSHNMTLTDHVSSLIQQYFAELDNEAPQKVYDFFLEEVEPPLLSTIMDKVGGNQLKAAKMLGLSRGTLRKKLHYYFKNKYFKIIQD